MKDDFRDIKIQFSFRGYEVLAMNIVSRTDAVSFPSHSHGNGCYEIHYIPSGYGKLIADGQNFDVIPNSLYITGPNVSHTQIPESDDPMSEYCIYLKINVQKEDSDKNIMEKFLSVPFWFGEDTQNVSELIIELFDELRRRDSEYMEVIKLLLQNIIIHMVRSYEVGEETVHNDNGTKELDPGRSLMIEDYFLYEFRNASLNELSMRLGLSERHTQRLLEKLYGKNFRQKRLEARMSSAGLMLETTADSISDISGKLGYSSPSHFTAEFTKYFGIPPREFRNKLRKK